MCVTRRKPSLLDRCNDVIISAMASKITRVVCWTVYSGQIKENILVLRHWPLWGESTGCRWLPGQRASYAENGSIWWRHHDTLRRDHLVDSVPVRRSDHWWLCKTTQYSILLLSIYRSCCMGSHGMSEVYFKWLYWHLCYDNRLTYYVHLTMSMSTNWRHTITLT